MNSWAKAQMGMDKELENPIQRDRLKDGLKNILVVIRQEFKDLEAEFEEEKKLHEQQKDDEFDKSRSKSA